MLLYLTYALLPAILMDVHKMFHAKVKRSIILFTDNKSGPHLWLVPTE
jgi:hypothetical protein